METERRASESPACTHVAMDGTSWENSAVRAWCDGKVGVRLPGKENSNSRCTMLVHLIISMIKRIRTSRLSIKNSLSAWCGVGGGQSKYPVTWIMHGRAYQYHPLLYDLVSIINLLIVAGQSSHSCSLDLAEPEASPATPHF